MLRSGDTYFLLLSPDANLSATLFAMVGLIGGIVVFTCSGVVVCGIGLLSFDSQRIFFWLGLLASTYSYFFSLE